MIDNPEEQLQRVVNRLRKVVEDYSAQVIKRTAEVFHQIFRVCPDLRYRSIMINSELQRNGKLKISH
jgi:hypothetical protein